jgi:L-threonylcarbamoyladenylate synthase
VILPFLEILFWIDQSGQLLSHQLTRAVLLDLEPLLMELAPTISIVNISSGDQIQAAAVILRTGGLVAFPTETVYGLGADASNKNAIARIYQVKNRPTDHPLIIHVNETSAVGHWAKDLPTYALALMNEYWPGPMTLVLNRTENTRDYLTGGQDTVALRIPSHPLALELLQEFSSLGGHGLAAPSANRYGAVSPTTAQAVHGELADFLGASDLILDGGKSGVGVESTIIDCTGPAPVILRPGAITKEMIEATTGLAVEQQTRSSPRVSGSHQKHYSPNATVVIDGKPVRGEGLIALSSVLTPEGVVRLAAPKTLEDYARDLYIALRKADELEIKTVRVVAPTGEGLAIAIRDRITRSAAL